VMAVWSTCNPGSSPVRRGVKHICVAKRPSKDDSVRIARALACECFNDEAAPQLSQGHNGHFITALGHQVGYF
jgi:hypothetical protein